MKSKPVKKSKSFLIRFFFFLSLQTISSQLWSPPSSQSYSINWIRCLPLKNDVLWKFSFQNKLFTHTLFRDILAPSYSRFTNKLNPLRRCGIRIQTGRSLRAPLQRYSSAHAIDRGLRCGPQFYALENRTLIGLKIKSFKSQARDNVLIWQVAREAKEADFRLSITIKNALLWYVRELFRYFQRTNIQVEFSSGYMK